MFTNDDIAELVKKGKADGQKLYAVSEFLYKFSIILNWFFVIAGLLYATFGGVNSPIGFLLIAVIVGLLCAVNYAASVLTTHVVKVLVHLLFSNLILVAGSDK